MGMTIKEKKGKTRIQYLLASRGYPRYAELLGNFDLNLTTNPNTIGFMEPEKGRIVVNRKLDEDQVGVIVRHELLHFYLEHELRLLHHLAQKHGLDYSNLTVEQLANLKTELYRTKRFNIAADYEISNRGYTEQDKRDVRAIRINGDRISGLVTEDKHPDWVDMTVEEMYDLLENDEDAQQDNNDPNQNQQDDGDDQDDDDQSGGGQSGDDNQSEDSQDNQNGSGQSDDSTSDDDSDSDGDSNDDSDGDSSKQSKSNKSGKGKDKKKNIQIGDKPDADELAKEDAERATQIQKEHEAGEDEPSDESEAERLKNVRQILSDPNIFKDLDTENRSVKRTEREQQRQRDVKRFFDTPLVKFKMDLSKFVKKLTDVDRGDSWKTFNKTYDGTGILRPGRTRQYNQTVPIIQVYYDRSGSWYGNEHKTQLGKDAIALLQQYDKRREIKLDIWYFDTKVEKTDDNMNGGTAGKPILKKIQETHPDNVIVMTDHDITDCEFSVQVPGVVWFLWAGGISTNLQQHLSGKKGTKNFVLE